MGARDKDKEDGDCVERARERERKYRNMPAAKKEKERGESCPPSSEERNGNRLVETRGSRKWTKRTSLIPLLHVTENASHLASRRDSPRPTASGFATRWRLDPSYAGSRVPVAFFRASTLLLIASIGKQQTIAFPSISACAKRDRSKRTQLAPRMWSGWDYRGYY